MSWNPDLVLPLFIVLLAALILFGLGIAVGRRQERKRIRKELPDFRGHKEYDRLQNVGNRMYKKLCELASDQPELNDCVPTRNSEHLEDGAYFPTYRIWFQPVDLAAQQIGMLEYDSRAREITVMPCSGADHLLRSRIYRDNEADKAVDFYLDHVLEDVRKAISQ